MSLATSPRKVLIIDDQQDIVELVKIVLRSKGYDSVVAYDGEAGLEAVERERPDLIITDLRKPKMSGVELLKRLRALPDEGLARTPVLVISSLAAGSEKSDAYWAAGLKSDDFLPKPFDPLSLLGRVEYLMRRGQYVSERAPGDESSVGTLLPGVAAGQGAASGGAYNPQDAEQVVRAFVESWNERNFAREFSTLGEEMLGGLGERDYIQRRLQLWHEEDRAAHRRQALDVSLLKEQGNVATVACLREDLTAGGRPERRDERYTLRRSLSGWKIVNVRSRPLAQG